MTSASSRPHPPARGLSLDLSLVQPALALLTRQPVLLAVTLQATVAGTAVEITVSKAVDEAGVVYPEYWWEVDRLTVDGSGQQRREKRWGLGLFPHETAEAAYLAAVAWVHAHPEVPPTLADDAVQ